MGTKIFQSEKQSTITKKNPNGESPIVEDPSNHIHDWDDITNLDVALKS